MSLFQTNVLNERIDEILKRCRCSKLSVVTVVGAEPDLTQTNTIQLLDDGVIYIVACDGTAVNMCCGDSVSVGEGTPTIPPGGGDPVIFLDVVGGILYYWDGNSWVALVIADTNFFISDLTQNANRSHNAASFSTLIDNQGEFRLNLVNALPFYVSNINGLDSSYIELTPSGATIFIDSGGVEQSSLILDLGVLLQNSAGKYFLGDGGTFYLGPPLDDATPDVSLALDSTTGRIYTTTKSVIPSDLVLAITALSPPVAAPGAGDPTILFNLTTGVLYYWNGATWEIGFAAIGNGAELKTMEFDVSSADILAMFATPVLVIPGEVGKVHSIIKMVSQFTYGGVAYAGGGVPTLRDATTLAIVSGSIATLAQMTGTANFISAAIGAAVTPLITSGAGVTISNTTAAFTTGNSTLKLTITYQTITL